MRRAIRSRSWHRTCFTDGVCLPLERHFQGGSNDESFERDSYRTYRGGAGYWPRRLKRRAAAAEIRACRTDSVRPRVCVAFWIDGVPPGHQPAPTDCETAVRNQPRNSQIIWGDNTDRNRSSPMRTAGTIATADATAGTATPAMAATAGIRTDTPTIRRASTRTAMAGATTTRTSDRVCIRAARDNSGNNGGNQRWQ